MTAFSCSYEQSLPDMGNFLAFQILWPGIKLTPNGGDSQRKWEENINLAWFEGRVLSPQLLLPHQFNVLQLICFLLRDAPAFATKLARKLQGGVGWAGGRGSVAGVGGMADCMSCGDPCSPTVDKQRVQHLQLTVYYAVNNVNKKKSKQVRRNYKLLPWKIISPFARQEF